MGRNFVKISFVGDDASLGKTLGSLDTAAGKTGSTLGGKLKTGAKIASVALLGGLAVAAKAGFAEFVEGEKITAQTEAVLKSTGAAAGVTTAEIKALAGAIGDKSGIDAEAIQSGQNLLLTFTNIKNAAGEGNDVFDQTTQIMTDMSVAMGTDVKAGAIQLGKALNDPIKGVSALSKVGVTFTKQQKAQIAAMMAAGDVAGAQGVILAELRKEFGGSAEAAGKTFAGQVNRLRNTLEDLAGALVAAVMPALSTLLGLVSKVVGWMQRNQTAAAVLVGVLGGLAVAVWSVNAATKAYAATAAAARAISAIFVTTTVAQTGATVGATVAQRGLNTAMKANVIGIVVVALALLVAGLVIAYKKSDTFREIVDRAFAVVKGAATTMRDAVVGALEAIEATVGAVSGAVKTAFGGVADFMAKWWPLMLGPIGLVIIEWDRLVAAAGAVWGAIKAGWDAIAGVPAAIVAFIRDGVTTALEGLATAGKVVAFAVWEGLKTAWEGLGGVGDAVAGFIRAGVTAALEGLATAGRVIGQAVWGGIKAAWEGITTVGSTLVGWIRDGITTVLASVASTAERIGGKIWAGIKTGIGDLGAKLWSIVSSAVAHALSLIPGPVKRILGLSGSGNAPTSGTTMREDAARKSHGGGIVPGRFGQEVPMTLLAGQRVMAPGQRAGGGAGATYAITVNSLDPRDAATLVIEAIRVYERTTGQRFVRA